MNLRIGTPFILGVIVIVAVLGMPLMLASPTHHDAGCPFAPGQATLCSANVLEHMRHWQTAFATVFVELLLLAALAILAFRQWERLVLLQLRPAYVRPRTRAPDRPTLFQELYSRGILNRKEPPTSFV